MPRFPELPIPQWVISDTHLGHANILTYCPWRQMWARDILQHDAVLIDAWNAVVGPEDWVLHLGDVAFGRQEHVAAYRRRLNGRICVVLGNHDRPSAVMHAAGFDLAVPGGEIRINGRRWVCLHDPAQVTSTMAAGASRVLHGHCHGDNHRGVVPAFLQRQAVDCGIDAFRTLSPVPWERVR